MESDRPNNDIAGPWESATDDELDAATRRVIRRLLELAAELDDEERSVLANLLAAALGQVAVEDVAGFDAGAATLPTSVANAIRGAGFRVTERPADDGGL
jgi:hypothetical protein